MSYKPYPVYKDSGIEWLGEIPEGWEIIPLKYLTNFTNGTAFKPTEWESDGYKIIRIENLNGGDDFNSYQGSLEEVVIVKQGDLLFGWSGNKGTSFGPYIWCQMGNFVLNQHIFLLSNFNAYKEWFYYVLNGVTTVIEAETHGIIGMVHVTQGQLGSFRIPVPSNIPTQKAIANFLDAKTVRIDGLVRDYEELASLLREKRQALVSHAVTRGLSELVSPDDPEFGEWARPVAFKDSGVEWLGDIPEGWRFGPIKHFVLRRKGAIKTGPFGSQLTADDMNDSEFKVYNQRTIINNDFSAGDNYISKSKFEALRSFEVFAGDLLITTRGTIGKCAIAPNSLEPGILHPCAMRIQVDENVVTREYLMMIIQESEQFKFGISYLSNSTTIEVIYSETIANINIPLPSVLEQQAITAFLDRETAKLDALVAEAEGAIELLKERRSALITAAVTGKINVEGAEV